jgi:hypothetical protein
MLCTCYGTIPHSCSWKSQQVSPHICHGSCQVAHRVVPAGLGGCMYKLNCGTSVVWVDRVRSLSSRTDDDCKVFRRTVSRGSHSRHRYQTLHKGFRCVAAVASLSVLSPALQKAIGFILASRVVLNSFRNCLPRPLEKQVIPLVIHAVRRNSFSHEKLELAPRQECGAGPLFLLVRAAALSDSKIIKVTAPSRKRLRMA